MVSESKTSVIRLENKFKELLSSIDDKFSTWKLEAISKIHSLNIAEPGEPEITKAEYELVANQNQAKENEISILQGELMDKSKVITNLSKENKRLSDESHKLNIHITSLNEYREMEKR